MSQRYGTLDEVATLSQESREMLLKRFMPTGSARRSIPDIAAEYVTTTTRVRDVIDHAVEQVIVWYERQDHAMHADDQTEEGSPYVVTDLGCAATIVASGYPADVRPLDEKRVEFVFSASVEARDIAVSYWGNNAIVDARSLFDAIRNLKSRIYDVKARPTLRDVIAQ